MIEKHASGNSQKDYGEVDNTEETDLNNSKERSKKKPSPKLNYGMVPTHAPDNLDWAKTVEGTRRKCTLPFLYSSAVL